MRRFDKRSPAIAGLLVFTRGAKQGRLATIDRTDRRPLPTEAVPRRQEAWVQGPGSRVQGPGSRVQGPGSRVQGANAGEQPGARPHLGKALLAPVSRLPGAKRKPRRQAGVSMRVGLPTCVGGHITCRYPLSKIRGSSGVMGANNVASRPELVSFCGILALINVALRSYPPVGSIRLKYSPARRCASASSSALRGSSSTPSWPATYIGPPWSSS